MQFEKAAYHGHVEACEILMQMGADTEKTAFYNELTPLAMAEAAEHQSVFELLKK